MPRVLKRISMVLYVSCWFHYISQSRNFRGKQNKEHFGRDELRKIVFSKNVCCASCFKIAAEEEEVEKSEKISGMKQYKNTDFFLHPVSTGTRTHTTHKHTDLLLQNQKFCSHRCTANVFPALNNFRIFFLLRILGSLFCLSICFFLVTGILSLILTHSLS